MIATSSFKLICISMFTLFQSIAFAKIDTDLKKQFEQSEVPFPVETLIVKSLNEKSKVSHCFTFTNGKKSSMPNMIGVQTQAGENKGAWLTKSKTVTNYIQHGAVFKDGVLNLDHIDHSVSNLCTDKTTAKQFYLNSKSKISEDGKSYEELRICNDGNVVLRIAYRKTKEGLIAHTKTILGDAGYFFCKVN